MGESPCWSAQVGEVEEEQLGKLAAVYESLEGLLHDMVGLPKKLGQVCGCVGCSMSVCVCEGGGHVGCCCMCVGKGACWVLYVGGWVTARAGRRAGRRTVHAHSCAHSLAC